MQTPLPEWDPFGHMGSDVFIQASPLQPTPRPHPGTASGPAIINEASTPNLGKSNCVVTAGSTMYVSKHHSMSASSRSLNAPSKISTPFHKSSSSMTTGGAILTLFATVTTAKPLFLARRPSRSAVMRPEACDSSRWKAYRRPCPVTVAVVYGLLMELKRFSSSLPKRRALSARPSSKTTSTAATATAEARGLAAKVDECLGAEARY